jgi:hypothetical protein
MTRLLGCFNFLRLTAFAIVVTAFAAHGCLAGSLSATNFAFSGTVNGIPGHDGGVWRGHEVVSGFLGTSVDVDFAVFAPGSSFDDYLSANFGATDPTDGSKFVYAFQVETITTDNSALGFNALNTGYDPDEQPDIVQQGVVAGTGSMTSSFHLNASSAQYDWTGGMLTPANSAVVFYTSPFAPQPDGVSMGSAGGDAGQSGFTSFASPSNFLIPEPSSIAILGGGLLLVLIRRRHLVFAS